MILLGFLFRQVPCTNSTYDIGMLEVLTANRGCFEQNKPFFQPITKTLESGSHTNEEAGTEFFNEAPSTISAYSENLESQKTHQKPKPVESNLFIDDNNCAIRQCNSEKRMR
jgi:hypothetical protein